MSELSSDFGKEAVLDDVPPDPLSRDELQLVCIECGSTSRPIAVCEGAWSTKLYDLRVQCSTATIRSNLVMRAERETCTSGLWV